MSVSISNSMLVKKHRVWLGEEKRGEHHSSSYKRGSRY